MPSEAWPILNQMAVGQQIPAGLHCIIQLFWTRAPAVSELAAAIELLLPPICTHSIERLLQPCPRCLSSILLWANWPHWASPAFRLYIKAGEWGCAEVWQNTCNATLGGGDQRLLCPECCSCFAFGETFSFLFVSRTDSTLVCFHKWHKAHLENLFCYYMIQRVDLAHMNATCFAFDEYFSNYWKLNGRHFKFAKKILTYLTQKLLRSLEITHEITQFSKHKFLNSSQLFVVGFFLFCFLPFLIFQLATETDERRRKKTSLFEQMARRATHPR